MTSSRVDLSATRTIAAVISLSVMLSAILVATAYENAGLALAALAGGTFCLFLIAAPPLWLAVLLIVLIPFQSLLTQLLGGFESSTRQIFALWKEVLLGVGILRVYLHNPNRKEIIASNRWVLIGSGLLVLAYCATFLREPSIPGVFSLDIETRFVGVMLFFMFLDLDEKRITMLQRAMLWSVGLLALYGLIQYVWDYKRLLPLVYNTPNLLAGDTRRLYFYSLGALEPAYAAVIAILITYCRGGRSALRVALPWLALLIPCLVLTYTRSAYLGLLAGFVTVCIVDRGHIRRHVATAGVALCLICAVVWFGGAAVKTSSVGQRLYSIVSQNDESSLAHKERMERATRVISTNPFGIGLGKYGTIQARFAGGVDKAEYAENWVLQVAVQNGVIGALAYVALTGAILVALLRRRRRTNWQVNELRTVGVGVFVAMTLAGIMIPVWDELLPTVYAWALVGMALGQLSIYRRTSRARLVGQSHWPDLNSRAWARLRMGTQP